MAEAVQQTARDTAAPTVPGTAESVGRPFKRRVSDSRIDHQPGFVLHSYPWRETSLIVEIFTREFGRIAAVARGAKRPTSQFRGLLSPFNPIALSWSGRNEIKTMVRAEWLGGMQPLRGDALLAAFYANELLVRLLARGDPHATTFGSYIELLQSLGQQARHDSALRRFELDLLQDIGYEVPLARCTQGTPIDAGARYAFSGGHGARRVDKSEANASASFDGGTVSGRTLIAMAAREFAHPQVAAESKVLLRQVIRFHLDGKPLNTRRILQDLKQL
ncbi:MAG: DNA repair protein RecO [Burkholderiaceae bacterium]